jgi:L-threonylcarbamoyladenylate synthase
MADLPFSVDITTDVSRGAEVLRRGGLVAFPTETVYGLGADATNGVAVARIFEAKGRPPDDPLIVHLARTDDLPRWAADVPEAAWRLASRFWPGPLTLILPRQPIVPDVVTAGLPTVGLRVPAHPVALALLSAFGGGVAAPSANRFGRVSPTDAAHVAEELGGRIDLILDGGPCQVGIESTIVDLSGGEPAILRPGGVTREMLEQALDRPVPLRCGGSTRAPGQYPSHYAPRARVVVAGSVGEARARLAELAAAGTRAALIAPEPLADVPADVMQIYLSASLADMARELYRSFRRADALGFQAVVVVAPPASGLGLAIRDRLQRAAGKGAAPLADGSSTE